MEARVGRATLKLLKGDITEESTDAIVNAANSRLAGGGGVDGAIHAAGGPRIMEECRKIGGCPTGTAVITTGGNLKAKAVIHTVGPIYKDGRHDEAALLESAYRSCLKLASERGFKSVSFPSVSTGVYGYPVVEAALVALGAVADFLKNSASSIETVRFVLFSDNALAAYEKALQRLTASFAVRGS